MKIKVETRGWRWFENLWLVVAVLVVVACIAASLSAALEAGDMAERLEQLRATIDGIGKVY